MSSTRQRLGIRTTHGQGQRRDIRTDIRPTPLQPHLHIPHTQYTRDPPDLTAIGHCTPLCVPFCAVGDLLVWPTTWSLTRVPRAMTAQRAAHKQPHRRRNTPPSGNLAAGRRWVSVRCSWRSVSLDSEDKLCRAPVPQRPWAWDPKPPPALAGSGGAPEVFELQAFGAQGGGQKKNRGCTAIFQQIF